VRAGPVFEVRDLRFRYEGAERSALDGVSLEVNASDLYAVIGPNGSGKSTLLKLLLGTLHPTSGSVGYSGRRVEEWSRRALAQRIGVVPQGEESVFPITVREMVGMGRYPHLGLLGRPGPEDREAIEEALQRCDTTLVLDEPTVSLDIRHEMQIFELLAELADEDGVTVVLVTHHLNLAARYAKRLLLLDRGIPAAEGPAAQVLTKETIERVYEWSVVVSAHPGPGGDEGAPQIIPLSR
jgi:iron complex transport system ATP-binding protein